ncbi:Tat pathway signal sequence domain protein [Umbribacter vaginalis]|jgi:hypothetical protein|nr:Tat pathway signal sequence domain protein [Coriobacteriales bacterium DNF00809]
MTISRRDLFKAGALTFGGSLAFQLSQQSDAHAFEATKHWKLQDTKESTSVCCYCAGGCGLIASTRNGELVGLEGDPDHFVSEGGLCPKGATEFQTERIVDPKTGVLMDNPGRITSPRVRRPGANKWEDITWEQAFKEIARHVKETRDATFELKDKNGTTVNRTAAIGSLGGSSMTIEEDYFIMKFMRSLGLITMDNQARV